MRQANLPVKRILFLLIFVVFGPFSIHSSGAQTSLQYTLRKGEVFTIKQEATQHITQELEGEVHEITNTMEGILEFRVLSEHEGTYEIAVTIKDLQLYMHSSTEGVLLDVNASEGADGDMQSRIFNSLLGVPIRIELDRCGDVLRVSGGDSLVSKMADASGVQDPFTLDLMKESLARDFGSEALSNSYEQMTFLYPRNKIRIGESWENEYYGKISSNNHWTLDALAGDQATIHGRSRVVMDFQEASASMSLTGSRTTEVSTDLSSGFLLAMKVESHSEGFSAVPAMGSASIPTTINATVTYKRI